MQILGRHPLAAAVLGSLALAASAVSQAQTATIYGSLGNFDVVNNTGQDACGFEVELEGVAPTAIPSTFTVQRYGVPAIAAYTAGAISGTRVRWESRDCSLTRTIAHTPGTGFAGTCYQWNTATYDNAGCEHFGVHYYGAANKVTSRWLVRDAANPGSYVPVDPPMPLAWPNYTVQPVAVVNNPPVVVAEVEAPEPPEAPERYGNAQWMKVFVRQLPRTVTLDELITENPNTVPMDPAQLEVQWDVIQAEPLTGSNGHQRRNRKSGSTNLDPTTRTVVRRYELYNYTGAVDPITNEALCADLTCTAPQAGELGDFISAQMTAVEVQGDNLTVKSAGTGSGRVESSDKVIACGNKCVAAYVADTAVTLSAKADSGSTFAGWSGACSGTQTTCTVSVRGAIAATANWSQAVTGGGGGGGSGGGSGGLTLKVATSNPGTVTSNVGGINCGNVCQANYAAGTSVTLTATPPAGKSFTGWSGACTGTSSTCTLTVNANLSAKASFSK